MEASMEASLAALEVQTFLELDAFVRALAARDQSGELPVPAQLLCLLPPPPEPHGWPEEFALMGAVASLREKAALRRAIEWLDPSSEPEPYIPHALELYPPRRRVQRLSFAIWAMIREHNRDLQRVLEVGSTRDRLRLALLRLRELRSRLDAL